MNEQNRPNPARRRRRKPRRPKWVKNKLTYTLWRNWPLIRFVILCLLALTLLCSAVSCTVSAIGGLFKGDGSKNDPPAVSGPADTTPPETTVPPETEPEPDELMRQADFLAAGYDYDRAIAMLSSSSKASSAEVQERIAQYQADSQKLVKWHDMQNMRSGKTASAVTTSPP